MTIEQASDEDLAHLKKCVAPGSNFFEGIQSEDARDMVSGLIATIDTLRERAEKAGWTPDAIPCEKCGGLVGYDNAKLGEDGIAYLCAACRLKEVESERDTLRQEVERLRGREGSAKSATGHVWVKSTHGHGEAMCRHCGITNREAAVLGWTDKPCPNAALASEPTPADKPADPTHSTDEEMP